MPKLSAHLWRKRAAIVAVAVFGTLAAAPLTAAPAAARGGSVDAAPAGIALVRPVVFRRFAARRFDRDDFRRFDRDGRRFAYRRGDRDGFRRDDRDGFRRFDWR